MGEPLKVVLLAHPAAHSLSPLMQNAALAAAGVNATYEALDVPPERLAAAVDAVRGREYLGANVTVPHKEAVIPLVDALTEEARAIGAVNTLLKRGDELTGHNTDGDGFLLALTELLGGESGALNLAGARAVLLGAGGSARAVAYALLRRGASVLLLNRTPGRAEELAADLRRALPAAELTTGSLAELKRHLSAADLLVNCTSVGMSGGPAELELPLIERRHLSHLRSGAAVVDLVYRPALTPLLLAAKRVGAAHQNGLPMLVMQGALAFEAWTGSRAPVSVMRRAAEAALAQDGPPPAGRP